MSETIASVSGVEVEEVTVEDGQAILDRAARRYLDMSGAEFVAAWEAGAFEGAEQPGVARVAALLPFAHR